MTRRMTERIALLVLLLGVSCAVNAQEPAPNGPPPAPDLVLIVCKTKLAGPPDQNESFTHWQNREWDTEGSMMVCRRLEVQLYDPTEGAKLRANDDPAFPLTPNFADAGQCARAGIRLSMDWDQAHEATPWRVWRVGCPVPMIDSQTGRIVGYQLPDCGHHDTVICEVDSVI